MFHVCAARFDMMKNLKNFSELKPYNARIHARLAWNTGSCRKMCYTEY